MWKVVRGRSASLGELRGTCLSELRGTSQSELAKDWRWLEGGSRLWHDLPVTHLLNVGQGQIKWAWGHKTQVILILSSLLLYYSQIYNGKSFIMVDTG